MKILFAPRLHTSKRLSGCSSVMPWLDWARYDERVQMDIIIQEDTDITGFEDLERINFIRLMDARDFAPTRLDPLETKVFDFVRKNHKKYTAVFTDVPYWVSLLEAAIYEFRSMGMGIRYDTPVVFIGDEVDDKSIQWPFYDPVEWAVSATVGKNKVMVYCDIDEVKFKNDAAKRISVSAMRNSDIEVVKPMVYDKRTYKFEPNESKELVIIHGGTLPRRKRVDKLCKSIEKARVLYPNIKLILTSPMEIPDEYKEYDFVECIENCSAEEYKEHLKRADVGYSGAVYICTGVAYVQAVYEGKPMMFLYGKWLEERLPHNYILNANGKRELDKLIVMLAKMKTENTEEYFDLMNKQWNNIHDLWYKNHSSKYMVDKIYGVFERATAKAMEKAFETKHFIIEILPNLELTTYEQFLIDAQKYMRSDKIRLKSVIPEGQFYALKALRNQE